MLACNLGLSCILYLYARKIPEIVIKKCVWALIILFITAACLDEPDCYLLNNQLIGISFKKLSDSTTDTLFVTGLGTAEPPLLFYADTAFTRLTLPLNYFQDETTYFFQDPDTIRFLRVGYISQAQFVSEDCGEKFVLSQLRILEHSFDSVRLLTDIPTRSGGTMHIEIYQ